MSLGPFLKRHLSNLLFTDDEILSEISILEASRLRTLESVVQLSEQAWTKLLEKGLSIGAMEAIRNIHKKRKRGCSSQVNTKTSSRKDQFSNRRKFILAIYR